MRAMPGYVLSTILLAAVATHAEDAARRYDPRAAFAESDTNHDGVVDHEEFHERLVEVFYQADVDKNGYLDRTELARLTFSEDFTEDDKNGDGRVSMREFLRVRFLDYDVADRDRDGVLSVDEVVTAYEGTARR